jgi:hypothetical protein
MACVSWYVLRIGLLRSTFSCGYCSNLGLGGVRFDMRKHFRLSAILAVIGALILGALGSGLWELLFKPLLFWVSTLFLNIATLGINSLRDGLYVEIARGHDPSGLLSFTLNIVVFASFFVVLAFLTPVTAWLTYSEILRRKNLVRSESSRGQVSFFTLPNLLLPSQRIRFLRWSAIGIGAAAALEVGLLAIILAREAFIANGVIYLHQSQRAIAPYLADDERRGLRSRAAQMKSRVDFDKLNGEILKVALANKVQLPEFAPF